MSVQLDIEFDRFSMVLPFVTRASPGYLVECHLRELAALPPPPPAKQSADAPSPVTTSHYGQQGGSCGSAVCCTAAHRCSAVQHNTALAEHWQRTARGARREALDVRRYISWSWMMKRCKLTLSTTEYLGHCSLVNSHAYWSRCAPMLGQVAYIQHVAWLYWLSSSSSIYLTSQHGDKTRQTRRRKSMT